ncbi:MAG: hypothetical protein ACR5LE_09675 [Symbiopectobacterium sp.]
MTKSLPPSSSSASLLSSSAKAGDLCENKRVSLQGIPAFAGMTVGVGCLSATGSMQYYSALPCDYSPAAMAKSVMITKVRRRIDQLHQL